ncbi:hypothetical protein ACROYT_G009955 [Oculina patagonica]
MMRFDVRKLIFIFIATTLLFSSFSEARSRLSRDDLPPNSGNFLGKFSSFHRPWYGGRREAELPRKVLNSQSRGFQQRDWDVMNEN